MSLAVLLDYLGALLRNFAQDIRGDRSINDRACELDGAEFLPYDIFVLTASTEVLEKELSTLDLIKESQAYRSGVLTGDLAEARYAVLGEMYRRDDIRGNAFIAEPACG